MRILSDVLAVGGILLLVYSWAGRFFLAPSIGLGMMNISATAGLVMAGDLLLLAIVCRLWSK